LRRFAGDFQCRDEADFEDVRLCLTLRVLQLFFDSVDGVDQVGHED
jgi:hypothetical protein